MIGFGLPDQPFPECKRLGMGIVDAKYFDAAGNPEIDDAFELVPQSAPIACFEIERIDVLVFLRRVLGVLHAAVGPMLEPLRMLRDVRMVGSALKRNVRALAIDAADGMNGRKIQHIEAHFRQIRQPRLDIAEFSMLPDLRGGRTWE